MAASALRWWPEVKLERLAAHFEPVVAGWHADWGLEAATSVECLRAHEWPGKFDHESGCEPLTQGAGEQQAWLRLATDFRSQVFSALFGRPPVQAIAGTPGPLAGQLVEQAVHDLQERLRSACGLPAGGREPAPPALANRVRAWSGSVVLAVSGSRRDFTVHMSPPCVEALMARIAEPSSPQKRDSPPGRSALETLAQALRGRRIKVRVEIPQVELDIGSLQKLAVGDVIRVPHLLDQPLAVHVGDDSAVFCDAYLGELQGRKAIECVRPGKTDSSFVRDMP